MGNKKRRRDQPTETPPADATPAERETSDSVADLQRTAFGLRTVLTLGMAAGVILSFKLWSSDRLYPLAPIFDWLPAIPPRFGDSAPVFLLILLVPIPFLRNPKHLLAGFVALVALLIALDQSRLQSWVYFYGLLALVLAYFYYCAEDPKKMKLALNVLRLLFCCIFIWAGIQKMNYTFATYNFPIWLRPFIGVAAESTTVHVLAITAAFWEVLIGTALLFPRFRKIGLIAAVSMQIFVLVVLGPLVRDYNSVIWPWNIAMISVALLLFRSREAIPPRALLRPQSTLHGVAIVLFGIVPALSFFNAVDAPLSFKLYSGDISRAYIHVPSSLRDQLPKELRPHMRWAGLALHDWSLAELNVPHYPADRIYWSIFARLAAQVRSPEHLQLIIISEPDWWTGRKTARHFRINGDEVPCENCQHVPPP